ncbi:hypothetical protein [Acinetobacter baumannii]|uniref:hypothetical protein n=1 Tax=Acinetobacter baumannii TaxID=470 RepID=UPI0034D5480C
MDKKIVKEIALANGFKLKEQPDGSLELNPYVYVFADKLVEHQQAKVEELQQENLRLAYGNTSYYNQAVKQNEIIDELQKRVDKALELMQKPVIVGEPAKYVCARFKEIEQALKGEDSE